MVQPASARDASLPGGDLPPVEPPSAGFIAQLFLVPAMIVLVVIMVYATINWLARAGSDPRSYVEALERNNEGRWQAAHDLADVLRGPRSAHLKQDAALARQLSGILRREMEAGEMDEQPVKLRVYLCHALGEFQVPDVLGVLLEAAATERDPAEDVVRFSALKALAVFASNSPHCDPQAHPEVLALLLEASSDEEPLIRSTASFALAAIRDPKATARLVRMLADGYPDVRYNAATMLARQGDERVIPVLIEMLDPEQTSGIEIEQEEGAREFKREMIVVNALRATSELARRNPLADLGALARAAERLAEHQDVAQDMRLSAKDVWKQLEKRRQPTAALR